MKTVYTLVESDFEHAYTHSIYDSKRAAYRGMLLLKRKRVTESLDFYRLTGEKSAEWCYRNHSDRLTVCEDTIYGEDDL